MDKRLAGSGEALSEPLPAADAVQLQLLQNNIAS